MSTSVPAQPTTGSDDSASPFTLASTLQHVSEMGLASFRTTFGELYRALSSFEQSLPSADRGQLTVGISLAGDASIASVSTPSYRVLVDGAVETITPDGFEEHDVYLSFWTDNFEERVRSFKESVVTEVLWALVTADRQENALPEEERLEYESWLAERRDDSVNH